MRPAILGIVLLLIAPITAGSQPRTKLWRLGYLSYSSESSPEAPQRAALVAELRRLGYQEGSNLVIEYYYAHGKLEKLSELAGQMVTRPFDVLVGGGVQASLALKKATPVIPIVSLSCDAVAAGLVPDFARPGGNVTGVSCLTADVAAKRLQLLTELRPGVKRVGIPLECW